jgi:hypothetical protein
MTTTEEGRTPMREKISGKLETILAGAILVVVLVLFVKYYEPSNATADQANGNPAATDKAVQ